MEKIKYDDVKIYLKEAQKARRRYLGLCKKVSDKPDYSWKVEKILNRSFKKFEHEQTNLIMESFKDAENLFTDYLPRFYSMVNKNFVAAHPDIPQKVIDYYIEFKMMRKIYDIIYGVYLILS